MTQKNTTVLIILDGFGLRKESQNNAVLGASMPFYRQMLQKYSHAALEASEEHVGLPVGQMGTSEVGHLNMGAGRIYKQELVRINDAIDDGSFAKNAAFLGALHHAQKHKSAVHLFGLLSDGGIHASLDHLIALIDMAKQADVPVFLHAFLDGRDTPPQSARKYLQRIQEVIAPYPHIQLSTLSGRYYAMDRDNRWERIQEAYQTITGAGTTTYKNYEEALAASYTQGITDEFIPPCTLDLGDPRQFVSTEDAVIFYNFRVDRPRELTRAFVDAHFTGFARNLLQDLYFVTMVSYDESIQPVHVAFERQLPKNTLAEWLSIQGKTQFHTAETEKYAHVTHFFNGGVEAPYPGETRVLIPSPKVATYDLQPAMSAPAVAEAVVEALHSRAYDFLVVNFANPDMVGHTGNLEAAEKALEVVDTCLRAIVTTMEHYGDQGILTADHGNCERMAYDDASPHTAHTLNLVPFILMSNEKPTLRPVGALCDVAPTLLELMDLEKPKEMTGESMIHRMTS